MAHHHSKVTHSLDEASATALISMEGLALFCFTEDGEYEGGFLRNGHHQFSLVVKGLGPRPIHVGGDGDIRIEVVNPVEEGMYRFERDPFRRHTYDDNHSNDFRWIIDAEGEIHGIDLDESHGSILRKLFMDSATIYTAEVSPREFVLIRIDEAGGPCKFFGRPATKIGALVECRDGEGSGLRIITEGTGGEEIFLPQRPGVRYEITFRNLRGHQHEESDFSMYYDVLSDPRGIKYDFRLARNPGEHGAEGDPCEGSVVKHRDGLGLACDKVYLSETSGLP